MEYSPNSIAVIGTGYWGKNLVRNFADLGALGAICDKNEVTLHHLNSIYPNTRVCLAFNDVLNDNNINAVAIATPAETHYRIAKEALLAGKHAFIEKPICLDENEADELNRIAKMKKLILMVGHLLQYHSAFLKLKDMVNCGELGRINYIYSNRLNLGKFRREENILWSFAPHDISMIISLAGEMPKAISAKGGYYLHKEIADVTMTHLEFASGLQAHIFVSWLHPYKDQKLVVVGDRKMAVFDDAMPWEKKLLVYPHKINWQNQVPVADRSEAEAILVEESEPLKQECNHFIECIQRNMTPKTDGNEGLRVLKVLKYCQKSLNYGGNRIVISDKDNADPLNNIRRDYFAHASAVIEDRVKIGSGTKIWHFSHILGDSYIGENCNIGQNVVIGPDVNIGDNCRIQNNVSLYKGVSLDEKVFCGPSVVFTNVINPRAGINKMDQIKTTRVKKGATLGANATIICGVAIGECAFIGAGAVVTKNVPDHALVVGNPAKQIGWVCDCGERLNERFECAACDNKFYINDEGCHRLYN